MYRIHLTTPGTNEEVCLKNWRARSIPFWRSRHLGSLTAANWVSFDFNVSYSSCRGYSLINTLRLIFFFKIKMYTGTNNRFSHAAQRSLLRVTAWERTAAEARQTLSVWSSEEVVCMMGSSRAFAASVARVYVRVWAWRAVSSATRLSPCASSICILAKSFKMTGVHRSRHDGSRKFIRVWFEILDDPEVIQYIRIHGVLWSARR